MKRVLVTGASGFIGQHCLAALAGRNIEVHAVSRHPGPPGPSIRWHDVDLLEPDAARNLARSVRATHLLHLAWTAVPGKFWDDPDNERWLARSLELVQGFAASGGERLVVAGTCAEYDWTGPCCDEDSTALRPATRYGMAKHKLHASLQQLQGLSCAWGRIFWLYGPAEHPQRLVPSAILQIMAGRPFECRNPEQSRDFLHVHDVAAAFIALLDSPERGAFNVASGKPTPLRSIVSTIARLLRRPEHAQVGAGSAADGPPSIFGTNERLRATGWRPRFDIDSGLADTVLWWRNRRP
jgi:nucleoside-diphosphate-sugar epimerase